jgi:hypothetical protein
MPLSPEDLRQLAKELESTSGVELEIVLERDDAIETALVEHERWRLRHRRERFRLIAWLDLIGLGVLGSSGIMVSVLTRPGTTLHEWAIGVGAPAVMGAGGIFVKRMRTLAR